MPNRITSTDPITVVLGTTGTFNLGEPHSARGCWIIQVSGTFSGSLTYRKKLPRSVIADAAAGAASYTAPLTDPENATQLTAAITAAGMQRIRCDGLSLILDATIASGAMVLECEPVAD